MTTSGAPPPSSRTQRKAGLSSTRRRESSCMPSAAVPRTHSSDCARPRSAGMSGPSTWPGKSLSRAASRGQRTRTGVLLLATRRHTESRPAESGPAEPGQPGSRAAERTRDANGLKGRVRALRQAAAMPDAEARSLLDAALAELDAAVTAVDLGPALGPAGDAGSADRKLLQAIFQQVPVGIFLLEKERD